MEKGKVGRGKGGKVVITRGKKERRHQDGADGEIKNEQENRKVVQRMEGRKGECRLGRRKEEWARKMVRREEKRKVG